MTLLLLNRHHHNIHSQFLDGTDGGKHARTEHAKVPVRTREMGNLKSGEDQIWNGWVFDRQQGETRDLGCFDRRASGHPATYLLRI